MRKPRRRVTTRKKPSATSASKTTKTSTRKSRTTKNSAKAAPKASFDRGKKGFQKAKEIRERQQEEYEKRINTPFDFRLKPGDEAEIVLLDDGEPFFVSLHKVQTGPKRFEDVVCLSEFGQRCPLCEKEGKEGSYTLVLTALDRRPFTTRQGKRIKASRKLLKVKGRNLGKFERAYKKYRENFRGVNLACHRDGEKEAAIGEDLDFGGRLKEAALKKYGENAQVAPYSEIFEPMSAEEMRKRFNISKSKVAGSEEFDNEDEEEYDMDSVGWGDD